MRHVVAIDGREPVLDTASKLFARVLYDALFGYTIIISAHKCAFDSFRFQTFQCRTFVVAKDLLALDIVSCYFFTGS